MSHSTRSTVILVCVGVFMTTLDTSIVNISLPSIAQAFHTPLTGMIDWVIIGYLVVIAALLLTFGRLSDTIGRRPIWTAGLVVFTVGSALCGAAPSLHLLVAARALQGVGGALVLATSTAILIGAVQPTERGRALGLSAVAVALGVSAGPTVGGLLTEHLSWRWIFYVNVPVGLAAIAATLRILPRATASQPARFDPAGALLLGVGIAALTLGLSFGGPSRWTSLHVLGTLGLAACALTAAVIVERRVPNPVLDLALFHDRIFASAFISLILSRLALFAVSFLMPFYFEELRGFSTVRSGWLLTPFPLTIAVAAPIAGTVADRFGSQWLAPLGLAIAAGALLLLARLDATSSTADVTWRLVVAGIGNGLFQSPNTRALMGAAPPTEQGEASGLLATARVTGQALSVAIAGAVFAGLGGAAAGSALLAQRAQAGAPGAGGTTDLHATFLHGLHGAFAVCAAFAAVGVLAALVRGRER